MVILTNKKFRELTFKIIENTLIASGKNLSYKDKIKIYNRVVDKKKRGKK